jgi:hypothetical protein
VWLEKRYVSVVLGGLVLLVVTTSRLTTHAVSAAINEWSYSQFTSLETSALVSEFTSASASEFQFDYRPEYYPDSPFQLTPIYSSTPRSLKSLRSKPLSSFMIVVALLFTVSWKLQG